MGGGVEFATNILTSVGGLMRALKILIGCVIVVSVCLSQGNRTTLFEGARLITGDGSAPIESSAFVIQNSRFTTVGRRGEVQAPEGATRVELTVKTGLQGLGAG